MVGLKTTKNDFDFELNKQTNSTIFSKYSFNFLKKSFMS